MSILQLSDSELACAEVRVSKAKNARICVHGADIICTLRLEQIEIAYRACADDLSDISRNDLSGLRLACLIADGHAPPSPDQLRDVSLRSMIRHTAHRHAIALRQRDIEQAGRFLRVFKKQLVEIAQPKKQERIGGNASPQPPVLLHHWRKRVPHHFEFAISAGQLRVRNVQRGIPCFIQVT